MAQTKNPSQATTPCIITVAITVQPRGLLVITSPTIAGGAAHQSFSRILKPTGRFGSAVTRWALSYGSPVFFTQTLRVSFQGFRKAVHFPSGESWAPAISGLPKKSSRSRTGGWPFGAVAFVTGAFAAETGFAGAAAGVWA